MAGLAAPLGSKGMRYGGNGAVLRLVGAGGMIEADVRRWPLDPDAGSHGGFCATPALTVVPDPVARRRVRPSRRRASVPVRRRRALLALAVLCVVGLALPLDGTGGHSHAAGSAPAGTVGVGEYIVRPGDSLWSIAAGADPSGDPRVLVSELQAQIGSTTVHPGEQLRIP